MGLNVCVQLQRSMQVLATAGAQTHAPPMCCTKSSSHAGAEWQTVLTGFDESSPGQRHWVELFGAMLADAATQVELAELAQQREREYQLQARLAELGSLAATVAHDVRNPLNIISMAVAMSPAETRQEVNAQIGRISRLTEDLLDYAKPWQIQPVQTDIAARMQSLARHVPGIELGAVLAQPVQALVDPVRFDQAVSNLLSNAKAAAAAHLCGCGEQRPATAGPCLR